MPIGVKNWVNTNLDPVIKKRYWIVSTVLIYILKITFVKLLLSVITGSEEQFW